MNISIFGLGYVGCVSMGCLAMNGHQVTGVDVSPVKINQINSGLPTIVEKDIETIIKEQFEAGRIRATADYKKAVTETDISIIAVGTPSTPNGHLNLESIYRVAKTIGEALQSKKGFHIVVIRSTVMPGTAECISTIMEQCSGKTRDVDFAVVVNPEFLREGTAVADYNNPPITLLGASHTEAARLVARLYSHLPTEIIFTDFRVAEILKYINNTFHALKISFANEIGNICTSLGIDSHTVMEVFCKDQVLNISSNYLKPGFAYGGSCLPKDLKGLQTLAHDLYVNAPLIESIGKTNELQIARAIDFITAQNKRKLGFLGLSFKAGTDDLRNSPAVTVIETLLGRGYEICIYDRNVEVSRLTGTNKEYIDMRIPHLAQLILTSIEELLQKCEVVVVNNQDAAYAEALRAYEKEIIIIDMVRLDETIRNKPGYLGINWTKQSNAYEVETPEALKPHPVVNEAVPV